MLPKQYNTGGNTADNTICKCFVFLSTHISRTARHCEVCKYLLGKREQRAVVFTSTTKSANDKAKVSIIIYVAELNEHRQNRWKEQNNSKRQTVTTNQHQEFQDMI